MNPEWWRTHIQFGGGNSAMMWPDIQVSRAHVSLVLIAGASNDYRPLGGLGRAFTQLGIRTVPGTLSKVPSPDMSLGERAAEALQVCRSEADRGQRVSLLGFSMGGHVAVKVGAEFDQLASLTLVAPAAYGDEAEGVRLGPLFTEIVSRPGSWANSSIFSALANLDVPIILARPEVDAVIPVRLLDRYQILVDRKKRSHVLQLRGASHYVFDWCDRFPAIYRALSAVVLAASDFSAGARRRCSRGDLVNSSPYTFCRARVRTVRG